MSYNEEAENAVLGSVLIDLFVLPDVLLPLGLKSRHFYKHRNRKIYQAMLDIIEEKENMPINLVVLADKLKEKKQLKEVGGTEYLVKLVSGIATSAHAEMYAKIVLEGGEEEMNNLELEKDFKKLAGLKDQLVKGATISGKIEMLQKLNNFLNKMMLEVQEEQLDTQKDKCYI